MTIEVKVPTLPESVADAVVVSWHKQPGDSVKRDESLVDIETDKVVLEVPATEDGVLSEIIEQEGATVVSNQLLAKLEPATLTDAQPKSAPLKNKTAADDVVVSPSAKKNACRT